MALYIDDEPDTFINVEIVYKEKNDLSKSSTFLFDFHVVYRRAPESDSEGEDDFNLDHWENQEEQKSHLLDKDLLIGSNREEIEDFVYQILENMEIPAYRDIVNVLNTEIWDLQMREAMSVLPEVEKINVDLDVIVRRLPGEYEYHDDDHVVDVKLAVAPASEEAVETHLETVVVENGDEGYCVICMDTIKTGSDAVEEAVRMPCSHVFHRPCGEKWLRSSAICPVCRNVFPS